MLYLKKIKLHNFWGNKDITIPIYKDVTIISGGNGSGKTTILDITAQLLSQGKLNAEYINKVQKTELYFEKNIVIENINFNDSYEKLQDIVKKEPMLSPVYEDVSEEIKKKEHQKREIRGVKIEASATRVKNNVGFTDNEIFDSFKDLSVVSTFDTNLPNDDDVHRKGELIRKGVRTDLDLQLFYILEDYSYYVADLAHSIEDRVANNQTIDKTYIDNLYAGKNLFFSIINDFFSETKKTIDKSKSELSFLLEDGKNISIYDLSSGEKQLLFIFIKTLLQRGNPNIMFMDEPEISLHVDWQRKLIKQIRALNPKCQLIIASHSPSMIVEGWINNVVHINDVKK